MSTPPTGPLPPSSPSVPSTSLGRADTLVSTWRVGQVLAATVSSNPQAGQAELRIGNLLVKAQTGEIPLSPGQTLRLEVASLKELPVLRLLSVLQQNPVTEALRTTLPRQQPLAPLMAALTRIAANASTANQLAPDVARLARELLSRLPSTANVTQAAGLRQALRDSGLFLEPRLAQAVKSTSAPPAAEINRDFKGNLIRLVQVLRSAVAKPTVQPSSLSATSVANSAANSAPAATRGLATALPPALLATTLATARQPPLPLHGDPNAPLQRGQPPLPGQSVAALNRAQLTALSQLELQRHAEGALARVQLNQLSSLGSETRVPGQEWLIELPIRRDMDVDIWSLRISRDSERDKDNAENAAGSVWSVMLAFDLPGIGPMQTRLTLRGDKVAAQFFSQIQGVLPAIAKDLPVLHARLQGVGLRVSDLTVHHGEIPSGAKPAANRILDERA